jgi:hypothetical protein
VFVASSASPTVNVAAGKCQGADCTCRRSDISIEAAQNITAFLSNRKFSRWFSSNGFHGLRFSSCYAKTWFHVLFFNWHIIRQVPTCLQSMKTGYMNMWNFRFWRRGVWRWLSSGMLCCVVWLTFTYLSEVVSAFRLGALVMEVLSTAETSVNFYQTTRQQRPRRRSSSYVWILSNRKQQLTEEERWVNTVKAWLNPWRNSSWQSNSRLSSLEIVCC